MTDLMPAGVAYLEAHHRGRVCFIGHVAVGHMGWRKFLPPAVRASYLRMLSMLCECFHAVNHRALFQLLS